MFETCANVCFIFNIILLSRFCLHSGISVWFITQTSLQSWANGQEHLLYGFKYKYAACLHRSSTLQEPGRRDSKGRLLDAMLPPERRSSFQGICDVAVSMLCINKVKKLRVTLRVTWLLYLFTCDPVMF